LIIKYFNIYYPEYINRKQKTIKFHAESCLRIDYLIQKMNALSLVVLAFLAIANALPIKEKQEDAFPWGPSHLPLPAVLREKYAHLMVDDMPETPEEIERVVGGSTVAAGGRPYQIGLFRSGSFSCGGSWISSNQVLTAAHCTSGASASVLTIRYGSLSQTGGTQIQVSSIRQHASYNSNTIDYDMSVLTLASSISPGTNAAIGTLAASGSDPASGAAVIVSGWGRTSGGGSTSSALLQASLNIVARATCNSAWGSQTVTARMICAHNSARSACNGDSGGPLTQNGVIVGVVSWGPSGCTSATLPTAYASVGNLRSWIG
jgi:trypsin